MPSKCFIKNLKNCSGVGLLFLLASTMHAQAPCTPGTLQQYIDLGSTGCTIDGFQFFQFSFGTPVVTGGAPEADASNIDVTPVTSGADPTIAFSAPGYFTLSGASGTESAVYGIDWGVDPGPVVGGESLVLDPPVGNVSVTQTYCPNAAPYCEDYPSYSLTVTPTDPMGSLTFPSPTSQVAVETNISISASPGDPGGFDGLSNTTQVNSATPEPAAAGLTSGGIAVLLALCWKRRRLARA